ncbi:MAG: GIY-YIG nuclease family protein [Cyclobacteriaceae bacterium]|nr:GIY-YIG nuclease family protein [Cyclobacteriaceae bacterium]
MKGYMYILKCANDSYYTGSTIDLENRLHQYQNGEGANFTKKHLPVELVYYEEFQRIDQAFNREKQVQGWSRKKKEALFRGEYQKLPELSKNYTQYGSPESTLRQAQGASTSKPLVEPVETNNTDLDVNSHG